MFGSLLVATVRSGIWLCGVALSEAKEKPNDDWPVPRGDRFWRILGAALGMLGVLIAFGGSAAGLAYVLYVGITR